jgi:hypothetical protein
MLESGPVHDIILSTSSMLARVKSIDLWKVHAGGNRTISKACTTVRMIDLGRAKCEHSKANSTFIGIKPHTIRVRQIHSLLFPLIIEGCLPSPLLVHVSSVSGLVKVH